jgi:ubiquinone/menaquinone biosynthesis C-methylase UbiE
MEKIINNFNNASKTYDDVAHVQKDVANDLIKFLTNTLQDQEEFRGKNMNNILDIGTGTGFLPEILLGTIYDINGNKMKRNLTLNDISKQMLTQAEKKLSSEFYNDHANFRYVLGDIENYDTLKEITKINKYHSYDLIISSLALQWINNLEELLKKLLKKTGILAFTTLSKGTFKTIAYLYKKNGFKSPTNNYPSFKELEKMIISINRSFKNYSFGKKEISYSIMKKQYFINFENFYEYKKYITKLGVGINFNPNNNEQQSQKITYNQPIRLNYNVFFCIIF